MQSVALVSAPSTTCDLAALVGDDLEFTGTRDEVLAHAATLESACQVRWVWWAATDADRMLVAGGLRVARAWDLAEVHRLQHGGYAASPDLVWCAVHGLDPAQRPAAPSGDLFDFGAPAVADPDPESAVLRGGYLRPTAVTGEWLTAPGRLVSYARAALHTAARQQESIRTTGPRAMACAYSESAAAALCLELEADGLPIDRQTAQRLIAASAGPRPDSPADAAQIRARRDQQVLAHLPGRTFDLRNPLQVKEMLLAAGIDVPNTRKWVLDGYRDVHPIVPALLAWRADERIATTYGYHWLDTHVGPDDRLRGAWTACDGAAGRMTAQNGLHNLPSSLRAAVAAAPGWIFVRADLGQIEPRVLAAVTGDRDLAAATRADDLYAPVAAALGVDRPVAKIAVLAAMYGQRSGAAGQALRDLERAYPVAMRALDEAYACGARGAPVRTFGGRLVRTDYGIDTAPIGTDPALDAGRGRFARNAVIQGSAAEFFKAWAATVRATTQHLDAQIVLCLHDELLVHVPSRHATSCAQAVDQALTDSARRWSGSDRVRFVADTSIIERWSHAKG